MRGCPLRWTSGPDRDCGQHADNDGDLSGRMTAMGIDAVPGGRHGDGSPGGGNGKDGGNGGGSATI